MGHHPPPGTTTKVVKASGLSPDTWMLIIAGIFIAVMLIYYLYNKKK